MSWVDNFRMGDALFGKQKKKNRAWEILDEMVVDEGYEGDSTDSEEG